METTETTVRDNFNDHPVQMSVKTAAAIALLGVATLKAGQWAKKKIAARKANASTTEENN